MRPVIWKRAQPRSLQQAMRMCIEHARVAKRRKMPELAELIGKSEASLYKWTAEATLPSNLIRPFEHACGCDYITRYLGSSDGRMVIDIPRGRKCDAGEVAELNGLFARCVSALSAFFDGKESIENTSDAIDDSMRALAWHQQNVSKHLEPELALFDKEVDRG